MKVGIEALLSDQQVDANQPSTQRQLQISLTAIEGESQGNLPLNLCLILDRSGSMGGKPLEKVKQAAIQIIEKLGPEDRLSIVSFNHQAQVIVSNQAPSDLATIKKNISKLEADGGTSIDEGLKLGMTEIANGKNNRVSQIFLLTDGENEHGDNQRCLKLAELASNYNITVNTLGFGNHWNPDILEKVADSASGTLCHIQEPEEAIVEFERLFTRIQSVGITNAHLILELIPEVRLAELKPIAQVSPETIELNIQRENDQYVTRLGNLMREVPRVILINLYLHRLPAQPELTIAKVQIRYDDPQTGAESVVSDKIPVTVMVTDEYKPQPEEKVTTSVLTLAKYRQTQLAEKKLADGDRKGAATLLQTAAKTALQLGDKGAATVLQGSATRLQSGEELSNEERKKTRMVSKTKLS